jgi:pyruvate/2-oxoglutarate dehydrogenase complex dihydrolipoamide acyltransferase (E2) component
MTGFYTIAHCPLPLYETPMQGRSIPLSPSRTFIADLSHAALTLPQGVIGRRIDISAVIAARKASTTKPPNSKTPWTAIFVKAWAEVAQELPELRRSYVQLPWARLFEHHTSVASLMVEREIDGEKVLFPARIKSPAERGLADVAADIETAVTAPIQSISRNRMILFVSRLPLPLRRIAWWYAFNMPRHRAHYVGTFGVSAVGHLGASILHPVSPVTTFLGYGPFAEDGTVDITVGFDHRVMDGAVIARAMALLEVKLQGIQP